jgi:hypothetical protein
LALNSLSSGSGPGRPTSIQPDHSKAFHRRSFTDRIAELPNLFPDDRPAFLQARDPARIRRFDRFLNYGGLRFPQERLKLEKEISSAMKIGS